MNLFYLLVYAFQHVLKEMGFSQLLSYPTVDVGARQETLLYREWVTAIIEFIQRPVHLILDGPDRLPLDAPSPSSYSRFWFVSFRRTFG